jgi:hypothetical protein
MTRTLALLLTFLLPGALAAQSPLAVAHAHNDYVHARPFYEAHELGFGSIEADVWLVEGTLLVGHDRADLNPERTLQKLYLEPLLGRLKADGGRAYADGTPLQLLIDLKTDWAGTLPVLEKLLLPHRAALAPAVRIVVSGSMPPPDQYARFDPLLTFDGRWKTRYPAGTGERVRLVSEPFYAVGGYWDGKKELPEPARQRVRAFADSLHTAGKQLRFWATPDTPLAYETLLDLGVDFVGTDDLKGLATFLRQRASSRQTRHVFLIMADGLRWQEVFGGADSALINSTEFTPKPDELRARYWSDTLARRREKLLPFFWNVLAKQGQLYGNRAHGNKVNASNPYWFSYPGYNEVLTGVTDEKINSNDKVDNPNVTVLEYLHRRPEFAGKVAAFASWDVFPYIINARRSGIPVSAGLQPATGPDLTEREKLLNELLPTLLSPWGTSARLDALTYHYAKEYVKKHEPRVLFLSFDETDDYAHAGNYPAYLHLAQQADRYIADLWAFVQSHPTYRNQTTFVITTDHGRGIRPLARWKDHGTKTADSYQMWLAVIGPDTPALGEVKTEGVVLQNQIARTLTTLLGVPYDPKAGPAVSTVFQTPAAPSR